MKARIDSRGNRTEYHYDEIGQLVLVISPDTTPDNLSDNPTIRTTYDAAGRQVSQIDALGHTTDFTYDMLGRLIETQFHDGTFTQANYDALGRQQLVVDQSGKTTTYRYDALGQLTGVQNALGLWTEYEYDEVGRLVAVEDASNQVTQYEYDKVGRRISTILPLGQRSSTTYDAVGSVSASTDFNGVTTNYVYDAQGRLVLEDYQDDADVAYTYTLTGQVKTITDGRGTTVFKYDAQDRLLSRTDPDGLYIRPGGPTIEYQYDIAGNRTAVSTPSGTTFYTFDEQNRLKTVTDPDNGTTSYQYDLAGNLVRTELPNNTLETRQYDDLNRLIGIHTKHIDPDTGEETIITGFDYTLNVSGHRVSITQANGRQVDYKYDDLFRLTEENINNGERVIHYSYDKVGNRLQRNDSENGVTSYIYDANDRLLTEVLEQESTIVEIVTYDYDDNGNLIRRSNSGTGITTYEWNNDNRLVNVELPTSDFVSYEYDSEGIRVSKTVSGETKEYLIDNNRLNSQVLEEYSGDDLLVSYIYGQDLISQERENNRYFYHIDGLGSITSLTDKNGQGFNEYSYDAFGNTLESNISIQNDYLFTGESYNSEIKQYYLRDRYYGPDTGRFIQQDRYKGRIDIPQSLNGYIYVENNPVNYIDPSGFTPKAFNTGNFVHEFIGIDFTLKNYSIERAQGRRYDSISRLYTINKLLNELDRNTPGVYGNTKRPDLVDFDTSSIYEIKVDDPDEIEKGDNQLKTYLSLINLQLEPFDTQWQRGIATNYIPPRLFVAPPAIKIEVDIPSNGLILYRKKEDFTNHVITTLLTIYTIQLVSQIKGATARPSAALAGI